MCLITVRDNWPLKAEMGLFHDVILFTYVISTSTYYICKSKQHDSIAQMTGGGF